MSENTIHVGPKVHPPEMNIAAERAANIAGMAASGQPWQDDCGAHDTAAMLAVPHPSLVASLPPLPVEPDPEDSVPLVYDVPDEDPEIEDEDTEGEVPDTVAGLKDALNRKGIPFVSAARKAELRALYLGK